MTPWLSNSVLPLQQEVASISPNTLQVAAEVSTVVIAVMSVILLVAFIIFPGLVVTPFIVGRIRMHRWARQRYGMFAPTRSVFTESRVTSSSDNAKSEFNWGLFAGYRANNHVAVLFFASSSQHMIVARQKLEDATQWDDLLSLIASKLPRV